MAVDYTGLTDHELELENQKEMQLRTESGERSEQIIREFSSRKQARKTEALLASLSEAQMQTIVEVATAQVAVSGSAPGGED